MAEELFKELLKMKINAVETIIDLLPETAREGIRSRQQKLFLIMNELTSEYLRDKKQGRTGQAHEKVLKNISIE